MSTLVSYLSLSPLPAPATRGPPPRSLSCTVTQYLGYSGFSCVKVEVETVSVVVSRFGLAVRLSRRTSVRNCFGSPFSSKAVVCGHGLVTLSETLSCDFVPHNYERLKWLSSLPTLMQKSFWW